jgi:hypothetical protein
MKTRILFTVFCSLFICNQQFSQNITNTIGTSGLFSIKDGSTTYLSLGQSNGYLNLSTSLILTHTYNSSSGVIFKGSDWFIHNFMPSNTYVGIRSGNFFMTGTNNSALGTYTLYSNTSGEYNSAFGSLSLYSNTSGISNSAFGSYSLFYNTIGNNNSAFGFASMGSNTAGFENTSTGSYSLYSNSTGSFNSALGYDALRNNTIGFQNTAIGHHSLINNTGNYNTALGYNSGSNITTGANLTCIGIDATPTTPTAVNQVTLGNIFVTSLRCNVTTITSLSDARDKKNIQDLKLGLEFISKLRPREFNWDKREWYDGNISDGSKMQQTPTAGFIAQELDEAQTNAGAEWLNLVLKDNPEKWEATPGNLLPVIVKAIQELSSENELLKERIALLEKSLDNKNVKNIISSDVTEVK